MLIINMDTKNIIENAKVEIENNILKMSYPSTINDTNWEKLAKKSYDKIKKSINSKGNVYIIMVEVTSDDKKKYEVKYIGKSKVIRRRIREHLVKCSVGTTSCLSYVKVRIVKGNDKDIYISTIEVNPKELNSYVETLLLKEYKSDSVWYSRDS